MPERQGHLPSSFGYAETEFSSIGRIRRPGTFMITILSDCGSRLPTILAVITPFGIILLKRSVPALMRVMSTLSYSDCTMSEIQFARLVS